MRLLVSWLRDFVDVTAAPGEIADKLGLRGFEVAGIEPLGAGDAVIDFEVTANRPDCLSVAGFAREVGTLYDLPLRQPSQQAGAPLRLAPVSVQPRSDRLDVVVEDAELCPRYAAAVAEVAPARSPAWMTDRLQAAGVRPISPLVDVTNYVLIELGHPMHAFDLATLADARLIIRRARQGETLTTLDGMERTLASDMLVIADAARPQAVAGVMGGAASEVSDATRTVAFESAYFKPSSVRMTSKRLGLKTEASARFERGADVNAPVVALQRAVALMEDVGAGRLAGPVIDRYPDPRGARRLHLRRDRLGQVLGLPVPDREVERILARLGLQVSSAAGGWDLLSPTFRVDLLREVDLIEEVGRHYGFDRLEPLFPPATAVAPPPDPGIARDRAVRQALTAAGVWEATTFGFIEAAAAELFAPAGDRAALVSVANPLSAKFDTMRPSLLPGLVDAVAHNRRHGRRDVGLFEIGARFTGVEGETRGVALALTGSPAGVHWSREGAEVDFFDAKGLVERLGEVLGVAVRLEPASVPYLAAGQSATAIAGDRPIGHVGLLLPAIAETRGAPRGDRIFVAELNLERAGEAAAHRDELVRALPRHPTVVRDLSIVVADVLPAAIIRGTIHAAAVDGPAPLAAVAFFDRYTGKGVPDGSVSLSLRLTFQAADRTLTDAEVQRSFERILAALVSSHGAVQR
jgi:phenylalanyl-tRNA synthetase beta chain